MDERELLVKNWLVRAAHDLAAAKKLNAEEPRYPDVAIFHCQQAAEKAIKGFTEFRYPGDLIELTPEEMGEALKKAETIVSFVIPLLPKAVQESLNEKV